MARDTPSPMPVSQRDNVNVALSGRPLERLDNEGRFIVRRMVADAYAAGFNDGRADQLVADDYDRQIEAGKAKARTAEEAEAAAEQHRIALRDAYDEGWWAYSAERQAQDADATHVFTKNNPYDHDDRGARGITEGA